MESVIGSQLCLKWNNHTEALQNLLRKICMEEIYSDTTIVCHGKVYPAHQLVLSTCSKYFEELFRQSIWLNKKDPFIIIQEVNPDQMEALLNYMYKGEVNVHEAILPELIKAAEVLEIHGLAIKEDNGNINKRKSPDSSNFSYGSSKKGKLIEKKTIRSEVENSKENCNIKSGELQNKCSNLMVSDSKSSCNDLIDENDLDGDLHTSTDIKFNVKEEPLLDPPEDEVVEAFDFEATNSTIEKNEVSWDNFQNSTGMNSMEINTNESIMPLIPMCELSVPCESILSSLNSDSAEVKTSCPHPRCSYQSVNISLLRKHVRTHTGIRPFQCPQCEYRATRKAHLNDHIHSIHSTEKPHSCLYCEFRTAHKRALRKHLEKLHPHHEGGTEQLYFRSAINSQNALNKHEPNV